MSPNFTPTILEGYVDNNTIITKHNNSWQSQLINNPIINILTYTLDLIRTIIQYALLGIWEFFKFLSPLVELLMWIIIIILI